MRCNVSLTVSSDSVSRFSTYTHLHSVFCGRVEGTSSTQVEECLLPRVDQLRAISAPFGKPSAVSRKKIDSGSVTLNDGVVLYVEDADKEFIYAISSAFEIDEVQSLILLRSFLYNQGLPFRDGDKANSSFLEETIERITPFYYSERLSILRVLIPLFRARETESDPFHSVALSVLPKVLSDGKKFAESLLAEYDVKLNEKVPEKLPKEPKVLAR